MEVVWLTLLLRITALGNIDGSGESNLFRTGFYSVVLAIVPDCKYR